MISLSTMLSLEKRGILSSRSEDWTDIGSTFVYMMLEPGVSFQRIEDGANRMAVNRIQDQKFEYHFWLQPLTGIVPGPDLQNSAGDVIPPAVIYVLLAVALLVVLSAAFNYTNLSTAQALSRAREVGIRKVIGARRYQIFLQFIGESVTMALLAFAFAFVRISILRRIGRPWDIFSSLPWEQESQPGLFRPFISRDSSPFKP
jgi:putative ABC transport system permease protein